MKIGILGSGDVAQALAAGFLARGDGVMLGTRDPSKLADWQRAHSNATIGSSSKCSARFRKHAS